MATADFTIADVLEWARTKPADESYSYTSCSRCAVAQFLKETGRATNPFVDPFAWSDEMGKDHPYPSKIDDAATHANTFGAFVANLEGQSA